MSAAAGGPRARRALLRPADALVLALALALLGVLYARLWGDGGAGAEVRISVDGREFARLPLAGARTVEVPGPAGITVVEVRDGRARCAASPGPQHLCERAGWLARGGDVAIGLPNRVAIEILARERHFDGFTY